jgi:OOP family OmpA-OmpF porin
MKGLRIGSSTALTLLIICGAPFSAVRAQQDVATATDHPLLRRAAGARIIDKDSKEGACVIPLGPAQGNQFTQSREFQGRLTRITYAEPPGRSVGAVYQELLQQLRTAGVQVLFSCSNKACGTGPGAGGYCNVPWNRSNEQRQLTGSIQGPTETAIISLHVQTPQDSPGLRGMTNLSVVEISPPGGTGQVGAGMATTELAPLVSNGFVELREPLFNRGSANLVPEAEGVLRSVAALLNQNPQLKVFVVNHTNNGEQWQSELDLSLARARMIVRTLVSKYGVSNTRLVPEGLGRFAPVASNRTDDGRGRNTRTVLVLQN